MLRFFFCGHLSPVSCGHAQPQKQMQRHFFQNFHVSLDWNSMKSIHRVPRTSFVQHLFEVPFLFPRYIDWRIAAVVVWASRASWCSGCVNALYQDCRSRGPLPRNESCLCSSNPHDSINIDEHETTNLPIWPKQNRFQKRFQKHFQKRCSDDATCLDWTSRKIGAGHGDCCDHFEGHWRGCSPLKWRPT